MIKFPGRKPINDMGTRYGILSFADVIVKSSNVGAIKIGLKVGRERMGLYIRRFGFGRPSSPDFPGESPGIVWDSSKLNDSALASVSMGYQVGVTPLQMAAAVSAVANGGTLYEPHVVRAVIKGGVRTRGAAESRAARDSSRNRRDAHHHHGGGRAGRHRQAREAGRATAVAGKTGTADKLVNGRYSQSQQNVSFVGFVPSRNPVLTVIVMIDSPRVGGDTGGVIAAPIFQRIADASCGSSASCPTINPAPPVLVARHQDTTRPPGGPTARPPDSLRAGRRPSSRCRRAATTAARCPTCAGWARAMRCASWPVSASPPAWKASASSSNSTRPPERRSNPAARARSCSTRRPFDSPAGRSRRPAAAGDER